MVVAVPTGPHVRGRDTSRVDLGAKLQLKPGQLGTDLNRDSLAALLAEGSVQPVRQIAIDAVWSALRFRPG